MSRDKDNWTSDEYKYWLATGKEPARNHRAAMSAANLEHHLGDGAEKTDAPQEVFARVRIHIHSRRGRLADPGGISFKALVDGLTEGKLLPDDSAKYVESITESQEQSRFEETVVTIWEVK